MKVLVCGPRIWSDPKPVERVMRRFPPGTELIHGKARGLDTICGDIGKRLGFIVRAFPVDNSIDGPWPAAGHFRNARMLSAEHPSEDGRYIDVGLVFALAEILSKGTANMAKKLYKATPAIKVREIRWIDGAFRIS